MERLRWRSDHAALFGAYNTVYLESASARHSPISRQNLIK